MGLQVTIGIAVYNVEKYISRCCSYLFNQTYKNIEFIFVDDASPDNSIELIKAEIEKRPDIKDNVKIINHQYNRGLSAARNTVMQNCNGDFIFWVDPDDYIEPDCIEILVNEQQKDDYDIVSCDIISHYKNTTEIKKQPDTVHNIELTRMLLSRTVPIFLCGRLLRVNLYKNYHIHAEEGINYAEDFQVTPKLAYYAKKVSSVHKLLYHYDCSNVDSYTFSFSKKKAKEEWKSFEMVYSFFSQFSPEFDDAIKYGTVYKLCKDLIGATKIKDQAYFKEMRSRLSSIEKKYWSSIPFPRNLILYIPNIKIARILILINNIISKKY